MHIISKIEPPFSQPLMLTYRIIDSAHKEDWESVIALNSRYVMTLRDAIDRIQAAGETASEEQGRIRDIEQLVINEKEIRTLIGARLTVLQNDINQLHSNLHGNNAYQRQILQS